MRNTLLRYAFQHQRLAYLSLRGQVTPVQIQNQEGTGIRPIQGEDVNFTEGPVDSPAPFIPSSDEHFGDVFIFVQNLLWD